MLTQEYLKSLLEYSSDTGVFKWKQKGRGRRANLIAGSINDAGYTLIRIGSRMHRAHRLAWLYIHGDIVPVLDHLDQNRSNNAISNLAPSSYASNAKNKSKYKNNSSGYTGVSLRPSGRWAATIFNKGKMVAIGTFDTIEEAISAREEYKLSLGYSINHS